MREAANERKGLPGVSCQDALQHSTEPGTPSGESPPLTSHAHDANARGPPGRPRSASFLGRNRRFSPAIPVLYTQEDSHLSSA